MAGTVQKSVPLETGGGAGTAGAHWAEDVFGPELMTGFAAAVGVRMPLSRVTVAAFQDMGYTVNYTAAEPFAFASPKVARLATARGSAAQTSLFAALGRLAEDSTAHPTALSGRSRSMLVLPSA
jgi:hypothetical protein